MYASLLRDFVPLLFGTRCLVCGSPATACCMVCRDKIADESPHRVRRPGIRMPTRTANLYRLELVRLIPAFKDDGAWVLARVLPHRLTVAVAACRPPAGTFLVPVPSRPAAIRRKGIDHTWVLVHRATQKLGIGAARLLRRQDDRDAQRTQGRARRQRLSGARFLVRICRSPVTLVDNVVTAGTPLAIFCEALTRNGTTAIATAVTSDANLVGKW